MWYKYPGYLFMKSEFYVYYSRYNVCNARGNTSLKVGGRRVVKRFALIITSHPLSTITFLVTPPPSPKQKIIQGLPLIYLYPEGGE